MKIFYIEHPTKR